MPKVETQSIPTKTKLWKHSGENDNFWSDFIRSLQCIFACYISSFFFSFSKSAVDNEKPPKNASYATKKKRDLFQERCKRENVKLLRVRNPMKNIKLFLEPTFVLKNINNKANIKKCLLKALTFLQYLVFGSSHLCYRNNLKMVKKGTCLTSKVAPLSKLIKGSYHKYLYLF